MCGGCDVECVMCDVWVISAPSSLTEGGGSQTCEAQHTTAGGGACGPAREEATNEVSDSQLWTSMLHGGQCTEVSV